MRAAATGYGWSKAPYSHCHYYLALRGIRYHGTSSVRRSRSVRRIVSYAICIPVYSRYRHTSDKLLVGEERSSWYLRNIGIHSHNYSNDQGFIVKPVASVAYKVILEPGVGHFVSSNPPECMLVKIRGDFFLRTN